VIDKNIKLFENRRVHTVWDKLFSVTNVINTLTLDPSLTIMGKC